MPVVIPILMPQMKGQVIIKAKLGQGESPREEETTMDEDMERVMREPRELREAPAHHATRPPKSRADAKNKMDPHPQNKLT